MSFPRVPPDMKQTLHDFLVKSQRELDRELARRPKTQDGVLYVGDESPLALTEGLDSTPFFLAIVDGKLVLKDEAGNVVFSGADTGQANTFVGNQTAEPGGFLAKQSAGAWFEAYVTDSSDSGVFRVFDGAGNVIGQLMARDMDGLGAGSVRLTGAWTAESPLELHGESWVSPTFQNGWENYGGSFATCQYRKLSNGMVVLKGLVRNGTPNSVIFTLPAAYRPTEQHIFVQKDNTGVSRIDVRTDGTVDQLSNEGTGWVSLSGLSFYTG